MSMRVSKRSRLKVKETGIERTELSKIKGVASTSVLISIHALLVTLLLSLSPPSGLHHPLSCHFTFFSYVSFWFIKRDAKMETIDTQENEAVKTIIQM